MTDYKTLELTQVTALTVDDVLNIVQDVSTTPEDKYATLTQLLTLLKAQIKLDDLATPDDNTDLNAGTTAHGLLLKATAPASGLINVVGIGNGETAYTNKALFDSTTPAAIGTASAGTSTVAARRDHVHANTFASSAEINTGTEAAKSVNPDVLAGSNLGIRYLVFFLNGSTALTTSDVSYIRVPAALNGMNLVSISASVGTGSAGASSSGNPTFTLTNVTQSNDAMLSTSLSVDSGEYTSASAATAAVIDTSKDDVATDDLLKCACTTSGTGTTYAVVTAGFQLA
jgi:hypothetical protein